jgi:uncharacterized RDD family membrane protein YckC
MSTEPEPGVAPVGFADRVSIATPEGVELELTLAGLGSRLIAAMIDVAIQIAVLVAAGLLLRPTGDLGAALFAIASFLVIFGYDVLFEVLANGRTPGKRWTGLRVVRAGGRPITLVRSALRNVLRLIDVLPFAYTVGIVAIFATRNNQRVGDLVAGSYVIRDRTAERDARAAAGDGVDLAQTTGWDVSGVGAGDLAAVRAFLDRRQQIAQGPRSRLAADLAGRLRPRVAGVQPGLTNERFLELLAAAKAARG